MASHSVALELAEPVPPKCDAGAPLTLKLRAECAQGCDLAGQPVRLTDSDGQIVTSAELSAGTADLVFTVPAEVGAHHWMLSYPGHAADGVTHPQSTLPIAVETKAHDTSLAVWDVPSPVRMEESFTVTVGATCTSGCTLAGKEIEIQHADGALAGKGTLGDAPWPQTKALYWTQIKLMAPRQEGRASWSVRFAARELKLPHGATSYNFGAQIVRPPQHTVAVRVVEKDGGAPLENAQVRLGVFFAYSGKDGIARVETPKDTYELDVLKTGYDIQPSSLAVNEDIDIQVEMTVVPKEDPDAHWYHFPDKG